MQATKLQGDVKRLQEHNQEVDGKAASLESELSNLRKQVKTEMEKAQQARDTLVSQQEARTPSLFAVHFTHVNADRCSH